MKSRYRTFFFCLFCCAVVFVPYFVVRKGITKYYSGGTVEKIMLHQLDADIAVFGSSVAWVHFDPMVIENVTGASCYNFGINGANFIQYEGLLKEYLEYSESKIIVLAGTSTEFIKRESIYEIDRYYDWFGNENVYTSLASIDPLLAWRSRYIPMYDIITLNKKIYRISLRGLLGQTYSILEREVKGFSPKQRSWKAKEVDGNFLIEVDNEVIKKYQETIIAINRKGKRVVLILAPIYVDGQKSIVNLNEVRKAYQTLAGEENIFLDFTYSEICQNKSFFYNNTHLNAEGAKLFSREFSKKLLVHL